MRGQAAAAQGLEQVCSARIAPPFVFILCGRRREMEHAICDTGQAVQAGRVIQISQQRLNAQRLQLRRALGRGGEREFANVGWQLRRHAQPHIATTDYKQALLAKAARQRAEGVLI